MKLLIASDLHGAAPAVRALVDRIEAEAPDRIVLLGDLLYHRPRNDLPEGYAPKEAIALLNGLAKRIVAVRGNCDAEVDQMVLDFPCMADYASSRPTGTSCTSPTATCRASPPTTRLRSLPAAPSCQAIPMRRRSTSATACCSSTREAPPSEDGSPSYAVYEHGTFTLKDLDGNTLREGRIGSSPNGARPLT